MLGARLRSDQRPPVPQRSSHDGHGSPPSGLSQIAWHTHRRLSAQRSGVEPRAAEPTDGSNGLLDRPLDEIMLDVDQTKQIRRLKLGAAKQDRRVSRKRYHFRQPLYECRQDHLLQTSSGIVALFLRKTTRADVRSRIRNIFVRQPIL